MLYLFSDNTNISQNHYRTILESCYILMENSENSFFFQIMYNDGLEKKQVSSVWSLADFIALFGD